VTSGLVAECLDALSALACLYELTLIWVPGHCGIPGNEEADKLARQVSAISLLGPESSLGIPRCSVREAVKNWTEHRHYNAWRYLLGHRHGVLFIGRPCKRKADDLLKLSRHQLKMAVVVLTGHDPVRRHLYIMGLFDGDPTCRFCGMETSATYHLLLRSVGTSAL
jgi:hypothetical protein